MKKSKIAFIITAVLMGLLISGIVVLATGEIKFPDQNKAVLDPEATVGADSFRKPTLEEIKELGKTILPEPLTEKDKEKIVKDFVHLGYIDDWEFLLERVENPTKDQIKLKEFDQAIITAIKTELGKDDINNDLVIKLIAFKGRIRDIQSYSPDQLELAYFNFFEEGKSIEEVCDANIAFHIQAINAGGSDRAEKDKLISIYGSDYGYGYLQPKPMYSDWNGQALTAAE